MTFLAVPAVVQTAEELLASARALVDHETQVLETDQTVAVSCRPNCNACCEHAIVLAQAECRAICDAVARLPSATQQRIAHRAREVLDRVTAELGTDALDSDSFNADFRRSYYGMEEPCPLLIDGACSVRAERPLLCREYLVSSDPAHCDDRRLEHVVRIRRTRHVSRSFVAVAERFEDDRAMLLPMALLNPPEPAGATKISGPRMARLLST